MLTASQCRIAAYSTEHGELLCPDCALAATNEVQLARVDAGLDDTVRPLIAYEVGEWSGEEAYELHEQGDLTEEQAASYRLSCTNCGEELGE